MKALLIAFERFPGAPFNPTPALAAHLARRRRLQLFGVRCAVEVLPVSYAEVAREVPRLIARHRPDVVLLFGLAARTPFLRIETQARNALSLLFPDAQGLHAAQKHIEAGAEGARRGRAPFPQVLHAMRATGLPVRPSRDAGRYICNLAYWHALGAANGALVQFIHVPALRRSSRRRGGAHHRLGGADLARAGEAVLLALVAAARLRRASSPFAAPSAPE